MTLTTNKTIQNNISEIQEIKAYKRRWLILCFFTYYSSVNAIQWIEYSVINNLVVKYYNVLPTSVNWTSIMYCALYPPLVIPASYIINRKGVRAAVLLGCLGTAIGTCVKVFSIGRDLFHIVLLGQAITSASQLFIVCLPAKIAAIWFKENEVSTACALGIFGVQLGNGIGFFMPPMIVRNHEDPEDIGEDLRILCYTLAIFILPICVVVLFYFPNAPPLPPSNTQAVERMEKQKFKSSDFFQSIKKLLANKAFVIHTIGFSINCAAGATIGTMLNQFVLFYFKDAQEDVGRMGLLMVIAGVIGSIIFGYWLDKSHKYKETTVYIYFATILSVICFMYALEWRSLSLVYTASALFGLLICSYIPVSMELAMELAFPLEETTIAGFLIAFSQLANLIVTPIVGYMDSYVDPFWSIGSQAFILLVGAVITIFIPNNLRRQEAYKRNERNYVQAKVDDIDCNT